MARTDWTSKDTVRPEDMNQIGQEINDLESSVTVWLGVTEGTDTGYTVTSNKVSSLYESLRVSFRAHQTSGINPTLQINSLGAIPLKKPNGRAAKLDTDGVYTAVYSAASFILQGEGGDYNIGDTLTPDKLRAKRWTAVPDWYNGEIQRGNAVYVDLLDCLYAANASAPTKVVRKFSVRGNELWAIADSTYNTANGVTTDSQLNVYAAFFSSGGIRKYTRDGGLVWSNTEVLYARDAAVTSGGDAVYVAYDNTTKPLRKLNGSGAELWSSIELTYGAEVTLDTEGNVYGAFRGGSRKLSPSGAVIWTNTTTANAQTIALDPSGNVYVGCSSGTRTLYKLNPSGVEIWSKSLGIIRGIDIDKEGNVYAARANYARVDKYTPDGNLEYSFSNNESFPQDVALDYFGNAYVCYYDSSVIQKAPLQKFIPRVAEYEIVDK